MIVEWVGRPCEDAIFERYYGYRVLNPGRQMNPVAALIICRRDNIKIENNPA